jgi:hypothetical protein
MATETPKRENPYKRGNYLQIMAFIMGKGIMPFTRSEVMAYAKNELGMYEDNAKASVTVVMSPRESSERGDCRGNFSAMGHIYFLKPLKRKFLKDADGKETEVKEEQRFQLKFREVPLRPFRREDAHLTEEEIAARDERKAKAKAQREANKLEALAKKAKSKEARLAKRQAKEAAKAEAIAKKAEKKAEKAKAKETNETAKAEAKAKKAEAKSEKAKANEEAKAKKAEAKEVKRKERIEAAENAKAEKAKAKEAKEAERKAKAEADAKAKAEAKAERETKRQAKSVESETEPAANLSEANSEKETAETAE